MTESTAKELLLVATKYKPFGPLVQALSEYLSLADPELADEITLALLKSHNDSAHRIVEARKEGHDAGYEEGYDAGYDEAT